MKKIARTFIAFTFVAVLAMVFAGCPDGGGGSTTRNPPTNLVVTDGDVTIGTSYQLEINDSVELTVSATGATAYYWDIKSGSAADVVTLEGDDTATVTITGKKIGSTKIVVYAQNRDGTISEEIDIEVSEHLPKLVIKKVLVDGSEISTDGIIKIIEGESEILTFEITDDEDEEVTGVDIQIISDDEDIATISNDEGIQVHGVVVGETFITITASKSDYKKSDSVTRDISVSSAAGHLLLTVDSLTGEWNDDHTSLTIKEDDNITLTVTGKVDREDVTLTSTEWEVTGIADIVTINKSTGVVTVINTGSTFIKVTAEADEAEDPGTKIITLVVTKGDSDTNVLFEWDLAAYSFEDAVTEWGKTISTVSGGSPGAVGDKCFPISSGGGVSIPDYPNITLRSYGTELPYNSYTGDKGFRLGGYTNGGGPRFVIGQSDNQATAAGDTAATNLGGQIDLSQKQVKITVGYADIVDDDSGNNRYQLRIAINNNTNTAANSNLGNTSSVGRSTVAQFIWNKTSTDDSIVIETNAAAGSDNVKQGSTKTAGELYAIIDPTAFASNVNKAALQNAFIMLHAQNTNAATSYGFDQGNWITITYIKIEYISGVVVDDPITLTVKESGTAITNNTISIDDDASPITLTTTVDPTDATVIWEVISGETYIGLTQTGNDAEIEPKAAGSATVRVTASKAGYSTTIQNFTVTVKDTSVPFNPLIWEWDSAVDSWTTIASNANGTLKTLPDGTTAVKVRNWGAIALNSFSPTPPDTRKGIVMGTTGAHRFLIGSNSNTNSDTSVWDSTAQFDFSASTLGTKKVKITVVYDVLGPNGTGTQANHQLRILINNNTVSSAGSIHSFDSSATKWYLVQESIYDTAGDTINKGPFTLEGTFDPTKAALTGTPTGSATLDTVLKNSYVAIGMMANTGSVLISKIRIEYVTP
jgi:hypothetical protein